MEDIEDDLAKRGDSPDRISHLAETIGQLARDVHQLDTRVSEGYEIDRENRLSLKRAVGDMLESLTCEDDEETEE